MMLGSNTRAIAVIVVAAIILLGAVTGILIANQLQKDQKPQAVVLPGSTGTPSLESQPRLDATVAITPTVTQIVGLSPSAERVPVPNGSTENKTGIAILPIIQLRGDRRYVLEITSQAGSLPFSGSYTRGSIDPKIAIDVVAEIKGTTRWEQEIQPPSPESRTWTLGVSVTTSLGKDIRVQVWDIGPK
ncbi:hypothetical protein [Candidatus Amarolinea aalborgensis]|uniref:hypothetical protein n=1 Tax=Candidatus Amarolinea aalborgensis TaxID=2249329 RepID=UPI003BFA2E70